MPVITASRPDQRFYINIVQYDDGNWAADPMPLDDVTVKKPGLGSLVAKGLRTLTIDNTNNYAQTYILTYAPDYAQRNALQVLATQTSGTAWQNATDMWNWINAVRANAQTLAGQIKNMDFNTLVTYTVPTQNWPAVPASLAPVLP
jgi:hypothetical protein